MPTVHSAAYGHSKATLRAQCALFFHISASTRVHFFVPTVHSAAYGHSKATLRAQCALFFHISASPRVHFFMPTVHSAAYGHSKATLRAQCALFFHISASPRVQAPDLGGYMKKQPHGFRKVVFSLVPAVGLEPTRMISPQDFESSASASFTTPAQELI